jgi:hypothetical protein
MNHIITGSAFMDWLEAQGVIPKDRPLQRVIIDAHFDGPVTIYWQELGTTALIEGIAPDSLLTAELVQLKGEVKHGE